MIDARGLPVSFREVSRLRELPDGVDISDRMIDAEIEFDIRDDRIISKVIGVEYVKGSKRRYPTLSDNHDWILSGSSIRPLPADATSLVRAELGGGRHGEIKFKKAINLLRSDKFDLPVSATERFYESGQKQATALGSDLEIPNLNAKLFNYQRNGVDWMRRVIKRSGGLILADEMGLGKTIQIIALFLIEKQPQDNPRLVVCPTSLLVNWKREFDRFAPSLSVGVHHGPLRTGHYRDFLEFDVVITTYDTIVNDISLFSSFQWAWLVCDEAQAIKNPFTERRRTLVNVTRERTILMTGTPVENYLLDLWSLLDFAVPGLLGSLEKFQRDFPETEDSAEGSATRLRRYAEPIILRRLVTDVANDLPERIDIELPLALDEDHRERYRYIRRETLKEYVSAGGLVATLRLQLFCTHPWLNHSLTEIDREEDADLIETPTFALHTGKVERTVDLLKEAFSNGSKVLVFSLFNKVGDILYRAGDKFKGVYWNAINGSTPQQIRQSIIDEYSSFDGPGCLVLNPKAAGAGLNITAATVVIHYTPVWNPALEAQASARAHRQGQTAPVSIYQLYYEDTVEEVMMERLKWKRKIGNVITTMPQRDKDDLDRALKIEPQS